MFLFLRYSANVAYLWIAREISSDDALNSMTTTVSTIKSTLGAPTCKRLKFRLYY